MTDKWKWIAVVVAILTGATLVAFGLLDGNSWATLVGTLVTGGGGFAAGVQVRK